MDTLHKVKTNIAARSLGANPELDRLDVVGGAAVAAAGGDIELVGRNLLQNQTFDFLLRAEGLASFTVYALTPGDSPITVEITVGLGGLVLTYVANKLTIELAAAGSSDDAIATAINADVSPCNGFLRAVSAGSAANFTLAQANAPLVGGTGDWAANQIFVGGLAALPANETGTIPAAKWSDTGIVCTTQAVGAATDIVAIAVRVDGIWTGPLSAVLV